MINFYLYTKDYVGGEWKDVKIEKTKEEYPYSYDPFMIYVRDYETHITGGVYSDRIYRWDYDKFDKLSMKYFGDKGQYFTGREPSDIEGFLQEYLDKELELIFIKQYVNMSSGYPLWYFGYKEK